MASSPRGRSNGGPTCNSSDCGGRYMSWQDEGFRLVQQSNGQNGLDSGSPRNPSSFSDPNSRFGGKGGPWRHMAMTKGARGESVMFVQGDVKIRDMAKYYPSEDYQSDWKPSPPRQLPTYYTGGYALDPNMMVTLQQHQQQLANGTDKPQSPSGKRGGRLHSCKTCRCNDVIGNGQKTPTTKRTKAAPRCGLLA